LPFMFFMYPAAISRIFRIPRGTLSHWKLDYGIKTIKKKSKPKAVHHKSHPKKRMSDKISVTINGKTKPMWKWFGVKADKEIAKHCKYSASSIGTTRNKRGIAPVKSFVAPPEILAPDDAMRHKLMNSWRSGHPADQEVLDWLKQTEFERLEAMYERM